MSSDFHSELSTLLPYADPARTGTQPRGINFKRLLRVRGPIMAGVAAALGLPLIVATWIVVPRQYTAEQAIRFAHTKPTILSRDNQTAVSSDYVTYVETNVNLIKGPVVLEKVVKRQNIRELPEIAKQRDPVLYLSSRISARMVPNTELVRVSYQSSDREVALAIVRAAVEEFLIHATMMEKSTGDVATRLLIEERDRLERDVERQREAVQRMRERASELMAAGLDGTDTEGKAFQENLAKAMADQTTAEKEIDQIRQSLSQMESLKARLESDPGKPVYEFGVETEVMRDPAVQTQMSALAAKDLEIAQDRYQPDNPRAKVRRDAKAAVEAALEQAKRDARLRTLLSREQEFNERLEKAQKVLEDAQTRNKNFEAELAKQASHSVVISNAHAALLEEQARLDDARSLLRDVSDKLRTVQVESRVPASIEAVGSVMAPTTPDMRRRLKYIALIIVASCAAGALIGLWRELTDQQIRTPQDVQFVTDLPLMALVPHVRVDQLPDGVRTSTLTADYPSSISADEFRRVITRIIYPPEGSAELNTCVVTSPSRGDGKTTLACNLAISLAQAGRRVLLLDICARRPSVEANLGMSRAPGLGEVFAKRLTLEEAARSTQYPKLFVLGPGLNGADVLGKLASRDIVELLEKAEESFEHVIIDTPPVLLMSDAKLLAPVVDGVIVVVGAEVSSLGMVRRGLQELKQIGANVIGVVLNQAKHVPGGYLQKNLDSYYSYAKPARLAPAAEGPELGKIEGLVVEDNLPSMILLEESGRIRPKQEEP